jgi:hypothetical protein
MVVSDSEGYTAQRIGEHEYVKDNRNRNDPYRFYATLEDGEKPSEIIMVMPLGGTESGLFRYPKIGDGILVGIEENLPYLMGYLPTDQNPFNLQGDDKTEETQGVLEKYGEVFRYKKTGANTSDGKADPLYSEIGFYHENTQWKAPRDGEGFPGVDRLNIQSTGDIKSLAQNHHQLKAKRFEVLVDCDDVDHGDETAKPFGDREGDDSALYAGDAHIRAKNRVVIKAGQELRLEVGRSAIILSDDGITIVSRKTQKNTATFWDTVMSLTPRNGITMFGQKVDIGAAYDFSLRESGGGAVSSFGGVMRLSARDILAQAYAQVGFQANSADMAATFNKNLAAMQSGTGPAPSLTALLPSIVAIFANVNWGYYAAASNYSDPVGDYAEYCGVLLQILSVTYTSLDLTMPAELREKGGGRDALNQAAMADEFKTIQEMLAFVEDAGSPDRAIHNSFLHLTARAEAVLSGFDNKRFSINKVDASVPTAGTSPSLLAKETKRLQKENTAEGILRELLQDEGNRAEKNNLWALDVADEVLTKLKEL